MTKRQKREQAIRNNPRQVRFDDLDTVMTGDDFGDTTSGSHVTYEHKRYSDLRTTVVIPHGNQTHVLPVYVENALKVLDEARRRTAIEAAKKKGGTR